MTKDSKSDGGNVVPFHVYFPELARAECRAATVFGRDDLPDDEYGLLESYCDDPNCDCRRVMFDIVSRKQNDILATVSFGFDPKGPMRGPFLDPLNRQCPQCRSAGCRCGLDLSASVVFFLRSRHRYAFKRPQEFLSAEAQSSKVGADVAQVTDVGSCAICV